jgi:hypothetical protein
MSFSHKVKFLLRTEPNVEFQTKTKMIQWEKVASPVLNICKKLLNKRVKNED